MTKKTAADYAREALARMGGKQDEAVNLLVQWAKAGSDVYDAFIPQDELAKRARQTVRKVVRERR